MCTGLLPPGANPIAVKILIIIIIIIIEFVPHCLKHVSDDGFNGGSDSYLQFRDTCGKR